MPDLKVAAWNIYFSHEFVRKSNSGQMYIPSSQETRADQVADHIADMDPHILGIVECMPKDELEFFRDTYFPNYECVIEGERSRLNLGMLYWPDDVSVEKIDFDKELLEGQTLSRPSRENLQMDQSPPAGQSNS